MIRKRWSLLAGVACVAVGSQIWALAEDPLLPRPESPPKAVPPAAVKQVRFEPPALARYDAISRRPVFAPSRRPPQPPEPPRAPPVPPPKVVLTGIAATGDNRTALIQGRDGAPVLLRVNDVIDGWRLIAIGDRSVTFERAGVRVETPLGEATENASERPDADPPGAARSENAQRRTGQVEGGGPVVTPFEVDDD